MARRHTDRERRHWAEQSVRDGITATARQAGVAPSTISKWRSKYGVLAVSASQATAPLELHGDIDLTGGLRCNPKEFGQLPPNLSELQQEAIREILTQSQPLLNSHQAARAFASKFMSKHGRKKVKEYRSCSWLLGLPYGKDHQYPKFQFDLQRRDLFPEVRSVNELLNAAKEPWGTASWWISRNARLDARPMELVGTSQASRLVAAAGAVIEPIG